MDPQAYQQLIDRMAHHSGSDLESFFDSHGLGAAYRAPDEGWGRRHRINQALAAARREGTYEAVLADALRQYGEATPTGEAPWPPARIRFELDRLRGDLEAWQPPYRRIDDAEGYVARLNELLGHLRANGVAVPDDFELTNADCTTLYPSGTTVEVVLDDAYNRLRRFVALLPPRVPSAAAVGPRVDERLTRLHPRIQEAAAQLYLDGHQGSAILEAFKAVNSRVKQLAGPAGQSKDGKSLMGQVFNVSNPVLRLNPGQSVSDRDEQEGFALIFMGAMQGVRNPKAHDLMTSIDTDRAFEYLAFASLLMRRLDDTSSRRLPPELALPPAEHPGYRCVEQTGDLDPARGVMTIPPRLE
jgi:uncharacterized protein (TIGR02391 family)